MKKKPQELSDMQLNATNTVFEHYENIMRTAFDLREHDAPNFIKAVEAFFPFPEDAHASFGHFLIVLGDNCKNHGLTGEWAAEEYINKTAKINTFDVLFVAAIYIAQSMTLSGAGNINGSWESICKASYWAGFLSMCGFSDDDLRNALSIAGKNAAEKHYSASGGSREKRNQICELWASGKYSSRDICAEQECAALGMSIATARKALLGTPNPS
jgi:hypothetical protein